MTNAKVMTNAYAERPGARQEKNWRILIFLPWLALPLMLGCYALLWSRLPAEIAVQFDSSGAVTNSFDRADLLLLELTMLSFVLRQYTLELWDARRPAERAKVITYYFAVIFITGIFLAILKFNL
jgi:hypothetical protein